MNKFEKGPQPVGEEYEARSESQPQRKPLVVIVEEEEAIRRLLSAKLTIKDSARVAGIFSAGRDVEAWLESRQEGEPSLDLVMTSLALKDGQTAGLHVASIVHQRYPNCEIDLMTGGMLSLEDVKEMGVTSIVPKPFKGNYPEAQIAALTRRINTPPPPSLPNKPR